MIENQQYEKKSLSFLKAKNTDWAELAKDCVCFANASGGKILIGIDDNEDEPVKGQVIKDRSLPETIVKAINHRTLNTSVNATIQIAENNAEYIEIQILRSAQTIASTTDGRYYIRISDECKPVPPDEMARLAADKNAFVWEIQTSKRVNRNNLNQEKRNQFINDILNSQRVSEFVKNKTEDEILEYYFLTKGEYLTNLGILWIGNRQDRASLLFPPAVQVIRYNDKDEKVWKITLDDYELNPKEILSKIIYEIPDWQ